MRSLFAAAVFSLALTVSVPVMSVQIMAQTADAPAAPEAATPAEAPAEAAPAPAPEAAPAPAAEAPAAEAPAATAAAGEPAYIGTWADNPDQCSKPQDVQDAPMIISKDRFDQHEAHCEFTSISGNGNEWKVTSKCTVEGDEQPYEFGMSVADKSLAMVDDAGTHVYAKCE
jgi:nucleoid-associated protein YgaU